MPRDYLKKATLTAQSHASEVHDTVKTILSDIEVGGDAKALEYAAKFDKFEGNVLMTQGEIDAAIALVPEKLKADMQEIGETNQLLKDEYQALSLALNSAEKKLREAKTENDRLLVTVIDLKEKDVARMNQENEEFRKKQQEKMESQLAEAAKEAKAVVVKEDT